MESLKGIVHRRIVFPHEGGQDLPITIDSIGHNHQQEKVSRLDGYETYHWLQTASGEGVIHFENKSFSLPAGSGVLLLPILHIAIKLRLLTGAPLI